MLPIAEHTAHSVLAVTHTSVIESFELEDAIVPELGVVERFPKNTCTPPG